jgi:DNA mismatch repair protein MSH3
VVPPSKRARTNRSIAEDSKPAPPPAEIPLIRASQLSSSQRTDIFKFQSSPAVAPPSKDAEDPEEAERKKEKEKLHQKFVRKLGGPDCLIGIGRAAAGDQGGAAAEAEEDDEEDEPAPPPPAKGKGAKKGGSKLTPMEKQVIEIKRKHMDTVLVIEVGYKFRFFGEDARIAAKELGIVCIPGKFRFDERMSSSAASLHEDYSDYLQIHRRHTSTALRLPVSLFTDYMYM